LETCFYNQDLIDFKLRDFWDGSNWNPQNREEYNYDAAENLLEILQLTWVVNQWQNESRISYQYDAESSEPSQMLTQYYYLEEWENNFLEEYQYNSDEQMSVIENFVWNNEWLYSQRLEYSYNVFAELDQIWQYSWQDGWENDLRITYNYLEVSAQNQQIETTNLIYPNHFINPTNLKFSLRSPAQGWVEIYNIKGQIINKSPIINYQVNWKLNKSNSQPIGSGIYFVIIKEHEKTKSIEKISIIK